MATVGTFFDGTNDEIVLGSADFTMTTTFSVWGMVYINSAAITRDVVGSHNGANSVVRVTFDSTNIAIDSTGGTPPWFSVFSTPNWYFFCITKAAGTVAPKLYLTNDGSTWIKDAAAADAGTLDNLASGAIDNFRIGSSLGTNFWNGEIAAIGISNTELNAATAKGLIDYSTWSGVSGLQFNSGKSMISGGTVDDLSSVNNDEASRVGATTGVQTVPSWFTNFALDPAPAGNWPTAITRAGTGTRSAGGTTTVTPALPTTVKGQAAIAFRAIKPETATATTESGWTPFSATGGTGATGADAGLTRIACDWKELAGGDSNPTFDQATSPNSVNAVVETFSRDPACFWEIISGGTGDDSSHGTGRSVTSGTSVSWQPGDIVLCGVASDTDSSTAYTSPSITISGVTLGATTEVLAAGGVNTGNDSGLMVYQATVASGQATAAAAISLTGGPSSCGPAGFVRIRQSWPPALPIYVRAQTAAATNVTVGNAAVTATANNSGAAVAPTIGSAAVTATGNNVTISRRVDVGVAAVTATANNSGAAVASTIGSAAVTATANNSGVSAAHAVGNAAVTATANNSGAAVASTIGYAPVTVTGNNVTVSAGADTNVSVGSAAVTVTANSPVIAWPISESFPYSNGSLTTNGPTLWSTVTGTMDGLTLGGSLQVASNEVVSPVNELRVNKLNPQFGTDEQYGQVVAISAGVAQPWGTGVFIRGDSTGLDGYAAWYFWSSEGLGGYQYGLFRYDDGVGTILGSLHAADDSIHILEVRASGNTISMLVDAGEIESVTDSTYPTNRGSTIAVYGFTGADPHIIYYESGLLASATFVTVGNAAVTATGNNSSAAVAPTLTTAAVTATGNNATPSTGVTVAVGSAAVTATANDASHTIAGGVGSAAVTSTANVVTAAPSPSAGNAAVTATANNSSASVKPTTGTAAVTATGNNADHQIAPTLTTAAVTVTGNNATVSTTTNVNVDVGSAAVTATANNSGAAVAHAVGNAAVTVAGNNVTVSTDSSKSVSVGVATVTATANDSSSSVKPTTQLAAVTVTANAPTRELTVTAGVASVTTTANNSSAAIAAAAVVALVLVAANNLQPDNGAGVSTLIGLIRAARPDLTRVSRPYPHRAQRPEV